MCEFKWKTDVSEEKPSKFKIDKLRELHCREILGRLGLRFLAGRGQRAK